MISAEYHYEEVLLWGDRHIGNLRWLVFIRIKP